MQKEIEEKVINLRILEAKLNSLLKQREIILNKILEIDSTLSGIDEIQNGDKKILFPIGSGVYIPGKVHEKKMIVEIGSNIALQKNAEETKNFLKKRKEELQNTLGSIQKEILEVSQLTDTLHEEIQKLSQKK